MSPKRRRIARVVDRPAVLEPDDKAGGLAHVDHLPVVDEPAAVARVGHRDRQSGDLLRAALVHRRHVLHALASEPVAQLEDGDDGAPALARAQDQIAHVVGVAVGHEDHVGLRRLLQRLGTRRVLAQPRIEQEPLPARRAQQKRRVPEPRDGQLLHRGIVSGSCRSPFRDGSDKIREMSVEAPLQFVAPREPKPAWLKVRAPGSDNYLRLKGIMKDLKLNTVCEDARCPNIGECWHHGTATFMILGDVCTRACAYCAVAHGRPDRARHGGAGARGGSGRADGAAVRGDHVGRSRRPGRRRRVHLRRDDPRHARARPVCRIEVLIPGFPGHRVVAAHGARRRTRRPQPQHRDRAAALSHGALRRPLPAIAGAARSLAPLSAGHRDQDRHHGRPRRRARRDPGRVRRSAPRRACRS